MDSMEFELETNTGDESVHSEVSVAQTYVVGRDR
jgi:hypothetical protein